MDKSADLRDWFHKEKWVDISRKKKGGGHPPCGRDDADKGSYPKCRPAKAAAHMSKKQKTYAVRSKRSKPQGVGGKPTMVATFKKKAMFDPEIENILESLEKEAIMAAKPFKGVGKGKFSMVPKKGFMERAGGAVSKFTSGGAGKALRSAGSTIAKNPVKSAVIGGTVLAGANAMRRPQTNPQTGQPTSTAPGRAIGGAIAGAGAAYGGAKLLKKVGTLNPLANTMNSDLRKMASAESAYILESLEKEARTLPKAHKVEAKMHKARASQHSAAAKRLHPGMLTRMMGMNTPERRNALKDIEAKSGAKADSLKAQLDLAKAQRNLKTTELLGRDAGKRN